MIPATTTRVQEHTDASVNAAIRRRTIENIRQYADADRRRIDARLKQLDDEWDMERVLEANAACVSLLGLALTRWADRRWFVLPMLVGGFLFQHAVQGWCPPVEVFRRLGVRTASEIGTERYALKMLRGDFQDVSSDSDDQPDRVERIVHAIER